MNNQQNATTNNTKSNGASTARRAKTINVRYMTMTAMLSAISFILMFLDFNVPLMPSFIQMDFSELPALIGAFAMGPVSGVVICLIKNLLHLMMSTTGGVGELCNFLLGAAFVIPAGYFYQKKKARKNALVGAFIGALSMAVFSVLFNNFLVYPIYYNFMPMETIIGAYKAAASVLKINFTWNTMLPYLIAFNMPFTFIKGLADVLLTFLLYKHISPIIKGTNHAGR